MTHIFFGMDGLHAELQMSCYWYYEPIRYDVSMRPAHFATYLGNSKLSQPWRWQFSLECAVYLNI